MTEPTTTITDFLLALELFLFSYLTFLANPGEWSMFLWAIALALLGLSALAGGIYHGFSASSIVWKITAVSIVATLGFMIAAGIISMAIDDSHLALLLVTEVPLLILIVRLLAQREPSVQVQGSRRWILIVIFALTAALHVQLYIGGPPIGAWLLTGSLIIFVGLWIQQRGFTLHKHFNHNDLCHIIFMIGMYFLYRGGLLFRDNL
jgi:hypothetical protein